tara:strand:+ start:55 stop:375 length:321 start_codon:yes stop_codon:yes gene_type:complete
MIKIEDLKKLQDKMEVLRKSDAELENLLQDNLKDRKLQIQFLVENINDLNQVQNDIGVIIKNVAASGLNQVQNKIDVMKENIIKELTLYNYTYEQEKKEGDDEQWD